MSASGKDNHRLFRLLTTLVLCCLFTFALKTQAQQQTLLSLQSPTTAMQTGQTYEVSVRLDGAPDVWLASLEIEYDPTRIYIIGTRAGSPVRPGDFFKPQESVFVARNAVVNQRIDYTVSLLAPADPVNGSGIIGTFLIYPLAPGTTQMRFRTADLTSLTFTGEGEQRVGSDPQHLPFAPVFLELTISGETVEPPSEATATPMPTETPNPVSGMGNQLSTSEPTLVNVPAAPQANVTPAAPIPDTTDSGLSLPLMLALLVMVVAGAGVVIMLVALRRSGRK